MTDVPQTSETPGWIEEIRNGDGTVTMTEAEIGRRICNAANAIAAARREGWEASKAEIERLRTALREAITQAQPPPSSPPIAHR